MSETEPQYNPTLQTVSRCFAGVEYRDVEVQGEGLIGARSRFTSGTDSEGVEWILMDLLVALVDDDGELQSERAITLVRSFNGDQLQFEYVEADDEIHVTGDVGQLDDPVDTFGNGLGFLAA